MSALKAIPKQAIFNSLSLAPSLTQASTASSTFPITQSGLLSFTFRAAWMSLARSGDWLTMNQGSTASAVAANPRARIKNIHSRMEIRQPNKLPGVDAQLIADHRYLVGESNAHIAGCVFGRVCTFLP